MRKSSQQSCAQKRAIAHRRFALLAIAAATLISASAANAADAKAGKAKAQPCVACHGPDGISTLPNAPNLAGQPSIYIADQLRQFRSGKRSSEVMAVIAKPLTDTDVDDLAAWYESINIQVQPPR